MNRVKVVVLIAFLFIVLSTADDSYADRRSYVWTYEYMTMPKGMWELEQYLTLKIPSINESNVNTLQYWLELEYGITDRWDIALYQMWKFENKDSGDNYGYDGFKIRTRYRFGEKGKYFIDPLIYFEYIRDDNFHKPNVGEAKLILAKDVGKTNISYNQILKRNLDSKGKTEHEYAIGMAYEFSPAFRFGIESKGNYSEEEYAAGTTLSVAKGKFWFALGTLFGLNKRTDDIQTRLIVGIMF